MYKVYGVLRSRGFRVMWALEELGQPYEMVEAGPHSDAIYAVNASGKIPALGVDGAILTDSTAIMTYLADNHSGLAAPAGTLKRAKQDAMTQWVLDEVDSVLWSATKHMAVLPEDRRVSDVVESCKWEFANSIERLAKDFKGPFLTGENFVIADIIFAHCLGWARSMGISDLPDNLRAYAREVRARPAFQAVMAHAE